MSLLHNMRLVRKYTSHGRSMERSISVCELFRRSEVVSVAEGEYELEGFGADIYCHKESAQSTFRFF